LTGSHEQCGSSSFERLDVVILAFLPFALIGESLSNKPYVIEAH
jgi:hypothetical protein